MAIPFSLLLPLLVFLWNCGDALALDLTAADFDALVFGGSKAAADGRGGGEGDHMKTSIVKFYAPWCAHSKALQPVWRQLEATYAKQGELTTGAGVQIARVDCSQSKGLCGRLGVRGYPTVKAFHSAPSGPPQGKMYRGKRDLDAMQAWIDGEATKGAATASTRCRIEALDNCDPKTREFLEDWGSKPLTRIAEEIGRRESEIREAEKAYEAEVAAMQARYKKLKAEKDEAIAGFTPGLHLLRMIDRWHQKQESARREQKMKMEL